MARGINKVILVGNLGADPDTRYMPSGKAVTNIRIATSESWKDKQTGDMQERTEWHSIVMYDKLGEIAAEYLRKGSQVYIEGKIRTRKWQDKEGKDRYTTEVIADQMQMLTDPGPAHPRAVERPASPVSRAAPPGRPRPPRSAQTARRRPWTRPGAGNSTTTYRFEGLVTGHWGLGRRVRVEPQRSHVRD